MQTNQNYTWSERQVIYQKVGLMENLQNASGAIVDLVYSLSPKSCFVESDYGDWILRPKNWIALHFSLGRYAKRLHVSLNIWRGNLDAEPSLKIKQGRIACWSKVTLEAVTDLPPILSCVLQAHSVN